LLLGGYRNSISYGSLDDLGSLVDSQANAEIQAAVRNAGSIPGQPAPESQDLLLALSAFFNSRSGDQATGETSLALVDREGRVIPGYSAGPASSLMARRSSWWRRQHPRRPAPFGKALPGGSRRSASTALRFHAAKPHGLTPSPHEAAAIIVAKPAASLGEVVGDLFRA
jgi:hypothetical protein